MRGSILGAIIMSMATVSLLIAIRLGDDSITNAGKYPLTKTEKDTVMKVPGFTIKELNDLQLDIKSLSLPKD